MEKYALEKTRRTDKQILPITLPVSNIFPKICHKLDKHMPYSLLSIWHPCVIEQHFKHNKLDEKTCLCCANRWRERIECCGDWSKFGNRWTNCLPVRIHGSKLTRYSKNWKKIGKSKYNRCPSCLERNFLKSFYLYCPIRHTFASDRFSDKNGSKVTALRTISYNSIKNFMIDSGWRFHNTCYLNRR